MFVSSVVLMWYLFMPSLLRLGAMTMDCVHVGDSPILWMVQDLEEPCWTGRHLYNVLVVGVPMIVIYCHTLSTGRVLDFETSEDRKAHQSLGDATLWPSSTVDTGLNDFGGSSSFFCANMQSSVWGQ